MARQTSPYLLSGVVLALTATMAALVAWLVLEVVRGYETRVSIAGWVFEEPMIDVLVARETLGVGDVITAEHLEPKKVGRDFVPLHVLSEPELVVGRVVRERVLMGDMFREERLAPVGAAPGLNAIIPTGNRALALNLRDDDVVSGFIEPGAFVDLIATLPAEEGEVEETITLAQAVRVLAVDERISETAAGEPVRQTQTTLSVSADLAERIAHVVSVAQLKLVLRSDIDVHHLETHGATTAALLGTARDRMSVTEFHERVTAEDIDRWVEIISGADKVREAVDPRLFDVAGFPDEDEE